MAPVLVPLEELGEEVVEGEREDDIGYEGVYETPTTWVETEGTWGVACVYNNLDMTYSTEDKRFAYGCSQRSRNSGSCRGSSQGRS